MSAWSPQQVILIKRLLLGIVMVMAFIMAAIPHLDYRYPLHMDEWMHFGDARVLMDTGSLGYPDLFDSGEAFSPDIEIGYHLWLGELQAITGISWPALFRFFPGVVLALLALLVYCLGRESRAGLAGAFFIALAPTTVRFLGPGFLVPVALGLLFIPLVFLVSREFSEGGKGTVFLLLLLFTLLFVHPPTFAVVSVMAIVYQVLVFFPPRKPSGQYWLVAAALSSIIAMYVFMAFWAPSYIEYVLGEAGNLESELQLSPIGDVIYTLGYVPSILFAVGIGVLAYRRGRFNLAIVISAVGLLIFLFLFPRFYFGPDIIYERGWLYIYVLMAIAGGLALVEISRWLASVLRGRTFLSAIAGGVAIAGILAGAFGQILPVRLGEPFYHIVDDSIYREFLWTGEHVPPEYRIGITDYGRAGPLAAIGERYAYTGEVAPSFREKGAVVREFFRGGARDTEWLRQEGISIVFTGGDIDNEDLIKINHNLYLLID